MDLFILQNIHGASRASSGMSVQPPTTRVRQQISGEQSKYLELLSRYYVHKRQHAYAAHVLLRLAEMRQTGGAESVTLEQRYGGVLVCFAGRSTECTT